MRIGLAGDWHGSFNPTRQAIALLHRAGVEAVLHVGDFGFYGHRAGGMFLDLVSNHLGSVPICVTPGNHEDYDYLKSIDQATEHDGWREVRSNIFFAPRGHVWEMGGRKFLSLGGAPSVDRTYRLGLLAQTGKKYWWAEEFITAEDVYRAQQNAGAAGSVDLMITHDAPYYPELDEYLKPNPFGFLEDDLRYADKGRHAMDYAVSRIQPKMLVHGHYHVPISSTRTWDNASHTRILGLNKEMDQGSLAILDTDDMAVEIIH